VSVVVAWTAPAVLALVAGRVFAGDPAAPLLTLLAAVVPLVALVRERDTRPSTPLHAALALPGVACALVANAVVLADFARLEGLPRMLAPAVTLVLTAAPLMHATARTWSIVTGIGIAGLVLSVGIAGFVTGVSPWAAWSHVASRPALVFGERSAWVTDGGVIAAPTTLRFDESHRVTAITAAVWWVTETDGTTVTRRTRRLGRGDSLLLRPGDRLSFEAGARVRFESGKRVPGAVASGVVWADPGERRSPGAALVTLGTTITWVGAALAIVGPARVRSRFASVVAVSLPVFVTFGAACAGIYAMYAAPEIALHATPVAPLHDLPRVAMPDTASMPFVALSGLALVALFGASAVALWTRVSAVIGDVGGRSVEVAARGTWLALGLVASGTALTLADGGRLLMIGFGLLATTWTAPALAQVSGRATVAGAVAGGIVFAICAVAPSVASPLAAHPALVAAPIAWATAAAVGRRRRHAARESTARPGAVAAARSR